MLSRLLAALGLAMTLLALGATPASAHATLITSDPGNGSVLSTAPRQVTLQFDVPVSGRLSGVSLFDGSGHAVRGASVRPTATSNEIVIDLPSLPHGVYLVNYRTRSDTDLHLTTGSIVFGVGQAATLSPRTATAASPSGVETAARWLELAGIALLIGVVAVWLAVLPAVWRRQPAALEPLLGMARRRLLLLTVAGYGAVLVGKVGQLAAALEGLADDGAEAFAAGVHDVLLATRFGYLWLLSFGLALVVLVAARSTLARLPGKEGRWLRTPVVVLVEGIVALVVVNAQSAHGTNPAGLDGAQIVLRIVHLAAAGLWVGGLAALLVLFLGTLRRRDAAMPAALAAFRQFGWLGAISVGLLGISGLVLAGKGVSSAAALFTTTYGLTLVVKVALAGLAMALGLRHTLLLRRPRPEDAKARGLSRSTPVELAAMGAVLLGAAIMGATAPVPPPARSTSFAATLRADTTTRIDDLIVRASMEPDRPGANTVVVQIRGVTAAGARPVSGVQVTLRQPGRPERVISGSSIGGGRYQFPPVQVDGEGQIAVEVAVARDGAPTAKATFSWPVRPPLPSSAPTGLLTAPLAPTLDVLAALLGLALLAATIAAIVRNGVPSSGSRRTMRDVR